MWEIYLTSEYSFMGDMRDDVECVDSRPSWSIVKHEVHDEAISALGSSGQETQRVQRRVVVTDRQTDMLPVTMHSGEGLSSEVGTAQLLGRKTLCDDEQRNESKFETDISLSFSLTSTCSTAQNGAFRPTAGRTNS